MLIKNNFSHQIYHSFYKLQNKINLFHNNIFIIMLDIFTINSQTKLKYNNFVIYFKIKQINLLSSLKNFKINNKSKNFGISSLISAFKYWLLPIIIFAIIMYSLIVMRLLPLNKILFIWFFLGTFCYWLISGFVFFIKKYQHSKFTSVIQRFWRRSFILFWGIEACLFIVFIYLTVNSNQEPFYMYDNSQLFKTHLFSWRLFLLKIFPLVLVIVLVYNFLLNLKFNIFSKNNFYLLFITFILFYIFWIEFYQFFHVLNFYGNLNWIYDIDEHVWSLEVEFKRTRISNHYVTICLIAKFWHIVFVIIFWIFTILRGLEVKRLRYPLVSANLQNLIIIFIMSWVTMYPWIKYSFKFFLESPFYWYYVNNRRLLMFTFVNDLYLFFNSFFYLNDVNIFNSSFIQNDFYYWTKSSNMVGYDQYKKNFIRDIIITKFN